jgi:hypothetical protein
LKRIVSGRPSTVARVGAMGSPPPLRTSGVRPDRSRLPGAMRASTMSWTRSQRTERPRSPGPRTPPAHTLLARSRVTRGRRVQSRMIARVRPAGRFAYALADTRPSPRRAHGSRPRPPEGPHEDPG